MPLKVKLDDLDSHEDEELALSILAGYKEGIQKKQEAEKSEEKE